MTPRVIKVTDPSWFFSIVDNVFAVLYFLELTRLGVDRSLACLVMVGSAVRTLSVGTVSWNCQLELSVGTVSWNEAFFARALFM